MNSASFIDLQKVWGTFDDWQRDFMACAMACGQGWAICGYNIYLKNYVNTIVSNHSQDVLMGLYPIVVLDLHEHAYQKDYLNDKKSYIIAMMRELNWEVIEERFKKAKNIAQAVK
jgi:Fe-Mn family superoxide dismutase